MAGDAVVACTEMQQMRRAGSGCDVVNHVIARRQVNEREIAQLLDEHLLLLGARDRTFRRIKPEHRSLDSRQLDGRVDGMKHL